MGKLDTMQEHVGNVSRETKTLRKNQKQMLDIKNKNKKPQNTIAETKEARGRLIDKLSGGKKQ